MYITTIPNRKSPPAILLRKSYREKGKVKNRTLANLSKLPPQSIDVLRRSLKGENLVSTDALEIVEDGSPAHGHVDAVLTAMKQLTFSRLICARRSRQRASERAHQFCATTDENIDFCSMTGFPERKFPILLLIIV